MTSNYEVPEPILNSPFEEPAEHWNIEAGETPERKQGRRPAGYFYRDPKAPVSNDEHEARGIWEELKLVNDIRSELKKWRAEGYPGVTRTTLDLLNYWRRDGRQHGLFFAQLEAGETIIFLAEARADFRQGIRVPRDEPSDERKAEGMRGFMRYACKMATGSGKTTVMAMLAAWSILNKVNDRNDARFSDAVLVVCPNVTIRSRLGELDPDSGAASLYRTRDIVPEHLMADLRQGRLLVTNWHVFEPQSTTAAGTGARVIRAGVRVESREKIVIGSKTTTARGTRYLTEAELQRQVGVGMLEIIDQDRDKQGGLRSVQVRRWDYVESDAAVVNRVLGKDLGGKQNILVFNDEAHHAYRIQNERPDEWDEMDESEREDWLAQRNEATVWVDGLDRVNKHRGINFCVDLSATPYFLGRVGQETNRTFPWVVSDFGLTDAIESGLTKIPQLVVSDTTGNPVPSYFNIWRWLMETQLTNVEKGGKKGGGPKPEAIVKYASIPIAMLAGLWRQTFRAWRKERPEDPRSPVFIVVCKNTRIAQAIYEWIGEQKPPSGVTPINIEEFKNTPERMNTIRVDSKVISETDTGDAKNDRTSWMRITLDTVGKPEWPRDTQGRWIFPEGFEALAAKLKKPLHPPGRDVRCIVSVGMLTEGWDCNTVTHIVGLRPFMSQLLCEQVVGRGLRRASYELGEDGKLTEEVAKVFGVPFEIIPFKQNKTGARITVRRHHIHALPERRQYEIRFPRVERYRPAIHNRVMVDWNSIAGLTLDPLKIPPEVAMKAGIPNNSGRYGLTGPGALESVDLNPYRTGQRLQALVFDLAADLTRTYVNQPGCEAPAHVLFPQLVKIAERYLSEKVRALPPTNILDVFLSPYYGWVIECLAAAIKPDSSQCQPALVADYERRRGPGSSAEVDFWTSRDVHEVVRSHLNYVVADTAQWEQSAAYFIDTHPRVEAFVKNSGLGFGIPYTYNGESHDYIPDFIIRLKTEPPINLILEVKGYDDLKEVKAQAAQKWVEAVSAEGSFGQWRYVVVTKPTDVSAAIEPRKQPLLGGLIC